VAALPYDTQFNFDIRKGKPWPYEPLIAPFDFAIYKSELELTQERIEATKNVHPVFVMDTAVAAQKIAGFRQAYLAQFPEHKNAELELCISLLTEVYESGIMQFSEHPDMQNLSTVTVLRNNFAEDRDIAGLYTVRKAIEFCANEIQKNFPAHKERLVNLFEDYIAHNVFFDNERTEQFRKQALESISPTHGMVQGGESIIRKGELVDNDKYQKLHSLRVELQNMELNFSSRLTVLLGHFIIVSAAIAMLIIFLAQFRKEIFAENRKVFFLMLQIVAMCYLYVWLRKLNVPSHYIVPVCILPIVVRTFFDTRIALFTSIVTLLIISFIAPDGFDYMFIEVIATMTATFSIINLRSRAQFFITVGFIFISYLVTYSGIAILHQGNIYEIQGETLKWLFISSVLSLTAFPLIFVFEKTFRILSDVSLMELADSNRPLLRELALKAPGTFQHSLQVANLAEAAVYRIGGNTLLVRTGALYHDIGKLKCLFIILKT
jgi:membrane-associated HD superfamily phosphohydrolase